MAKSVIVCLFRLGGVSGLNRSSPKAECAMMDSVSFISFITNVITVWFLEIAHVLMGSVSFISYHDNVINVYKIIKICNFVGSAHFISFNINVYNAFYLIDAFHFLKQLHIWKIDKKIWTH